MTAILTAIFLIRTILTVRVAIAVPMLSDTAAICAAELLIRTFTHVCHRTAHTVRIIGQCKWSCVALCVPTTIFITVVPAVVVAIAVPEAANAVAILTVELVLLAFPGSYSGKKKEDA